MVHKKLHIIITGDEGHGRAFILNKNTIRNSVIVSLLTAFLLTTGTIQGIRYLKQNSMLKHRAASLDRQLAETTNKLNTLRLEKKQLVSTYEETVASLRRDQANLLKGSISRLDERSKVIQSVIDHIGIKVKTDEDPDHSGGPFINPNDKNYEDKLISRTNQYLDVLNKIPLGRPVPGAISSKFGLRIDPIRHKKGFHPGIDFRGHTGDPIQATADGIVEKAGYNKTLGRYIFIAHGNGYETIFGHLNALLVKKGDTVTRGQVIGRIGNTGRSTGSHLHYGIRYNKKPINPIKYLQVAGLSVTVKR